MSDSSHEMARSHKEDAPQDKPLEEQTILEQMGGLTGLVAATLPVVVLIPVNSFFGLGPALFAALGVAILIMAWRIIRKETVQPAVSGLLGVAICAAIAWFTGDAKGYFLYGIWMSLVLGVLTLISIIVRWPAVGVVWKGINGESMVWRQVPAARRAYALATAGWTLIFFARFFVQNTIYNAGESTTELGVVRILMGWPLTGVVTVLTVWMVRRANEAVEAAIAAGTVTPQDETPAESEKESSDGHE